MSKKLINLCPKQLNKLVGRRAANASPHLSLSNWPGWTILGHKRFTNLPENNCIQKYPQWMHFFTSTLSFQKERYLKPPSQTISSMLTYHTEKRVTGGVSFQQMGRKQNRKLLPSNWPIVNLYGQDHSKPPYWDRLQLLGAPIMSSYISANSATRGIQGVLI